MDELDTPEYKALFGKFPSLRSAFETGVESHDGREQKLLSFILSHPNLSRFKESPAKLLEAIDQYSHEHDFLISIGPHKAGILSSLIIDQKPKTVIELGGYLGYSAILFADAVKRAHPGLSGPKVWSLELSAEFAAIAVQLVALAGLSDIVSVVVGTADESLSKLYIESKISAGGVDLLFLDHSEELYAADFKVCEGLGLFKEGSVVVADNVVRPGAPKHRALVRNLKGWKSEGVRGLIQPGDLEDELEVSYFVREARI